MINTIVIILIYQCAGVPIDERERDVQLLQHLESIEKCLVKEAKPKKKHKLPFLRRLFSTGSRFKWKLN